MKVIFFNMQSELSTLGLLNVITHLEGNGCLCKHVYLVKPELETQQELDSILSFIRRENPGLIGFSLMTFNFFRARRLTLAIKEHFPDIPVLWGGIHPTFAPEEAVQYADYVCIGEGEDAALELIRAFEKDAQKDRILNIWAKRNNEVIKNDVRPLIQNLDDYPFPKINWENTYCLHKGEIAPFGRELYRKYTYRKGAVYDVIVSRGCPYSCSYCHNALFRDIYESKGEYIRYRSVDNVISELQYAKKDLPYIDMINIEDDAFTCLSEDYLKEFSEKYRRFIGLPLGLRIALTRTNEEKIKYLANANTYVAVVGVQASERINKEIFNRHISTQKILKIAELLKKYNIVGQYHLITGNPYATEKDMVEMCKILSRLPKPYQFVQFKLAFFPNTPLQKKAIADGIAVNPLDGYEFPYGNYPENFPHIHKIAEIAPYVPRFLVDFLLYSRNRLPGRVFLKICHLLVFKSISFLDKIILQNSKLVILTKKIMIALNRILPKSIY